MNSVYSGEVYRRVQRRLCVSAKGLTRAVLSVRYKQHDIDMMVGSRQNQSQFVGMLFANPKP
jgi:hypothetical protein